MTTVLITGASSGIGYATALAFARDGASIVGTARRADRLAELEHAIEDLDRGAFVAVTADVRNPADIRHAVAEAVNHFDSLDVVIANAGLGQRGSVVDSDWDNLETLMRTNMDGVLHTIRAAVPEMRKSGGGHIIIVSSVTYNMVSPYAAVYAASKAFVSSIAHSLRLELEDDNIRVTDMLVGRTESAFSQNRLGEAGYGEKASSLPRMSVEEVATAIVKASKGNRKSVALRWLDRVIMLGNLFVPDIIGRRAMKQYR